MKQKEILYQNVSQLIKLHDITLSVFAKNLKNVSYDRLRQWFSRKSIPIIHIDEIRILLSKMLNKEITNEVLLDESDFIDVTVTLTKDDFEKLKSITHKKDTLNKRLNRLISIIINENYKS